MALCYYFTELRGNLLESAKCGIAKDVGHVASVTTVWTLLTHRAFIRDEPNVHGPQGTSQTIWTSARENNQARLYNSFPTDNFATVSVSNWCCLYFVRSNFPFYFNVFCLQVVKVLFLCVLAI